MADIKHFQSLDGGNVAIPDNDDVQLTGGFETAFYYSLFGGDERDDGREGNQYNLWMNFMEDDIAYQYRSKTQYLLQSLPLVSGNIRKIEDAVKYDLKPIIDSGAITDLAVSVTIAGNRRVNINIQAYADGTKINIDFLANWQAMEQEFNA